MTYIIIADWDVNFHPTRMNTKETEAEAIALVEKLINDMPQGQEAPNAFYALMPVGNDVRYMVVDPVAKTLSYDTEQEAVDKRTQDWKSQIQEGDLTSRDIENIIDALSDTIKSKIDSNTMDKYNAKKALRLTKPQE